MTWALTSEDCPSVPQMARAVQHHGTLGTYRAPHRRRRPEAFWHKVFLGKKCPIWPPFPDCTNPSRFRFPSVSVNDPCSAGLDLSVLCVSCVLQR